LAIFLAQTTQSQPTSQPTTQSATGSFFFLALMLALVVFMILSARTQKKREKRERDEMHARLAKNDRVLTIGGVIGTVHSIRDNEVVVKVDESTNTKMIFLKSAIQRIITDDEGMQAKG
jgi:preprotein translocase subunit YajC